MGRDARAEIPALPLGIGTLLLRGAGKGERKRDHNNERFFAAADSGEVLPVARAM
jgi:hypothetical protein